MISLMSRILAIAGKYRRNIKIAFIFSFLKSMLAKSPIGLAFIAFNAFYNNKMSEIGRASCRERVSTLV